MNGPSSTTDSGRVAAPEVTTWAATLMEPTTSTLGRWVLATTCTSGETTGDRPRAGVPGHPHRPDDAGRRQRSTSGNVSVGRCVCGSVTTSAGPCATASNSHDRRSGGRNRRARRRRARARRPPHPLRCYCAPSKTSPAPTPLASITWARCGAPRPALKPTGRPNRGWRHADRHRPPHRETRRTTYAGLDPATKAVRDFIAATREMVGRMAD